MNLATDEPLISDLADRVLIDIRRGRGRPESSLRPMAMTAAAACLVAVVGVYFAGPAWDSLFNPLTDLSNTHAILENR